MAEPTCIRPRCNRRLNLDEQGRCGGHACPAPQCAETKSNTERLCTACTDNTTKPLPKTWKLVWVDINNDAVMVPVYVCEKTRIAQYEFPASKFDMRKASMKKLPAKKHAPTQYCVEPQPSNLVKPWKQVLALPDLGKGAQTDSPAGIGAVLLFWNPEDGSIQQSDPRPDEDTDPLPPGWDRAYDNDGDEYFVNLNSGIKTYDDPRDDVQITPSAFLMSESDIAQEPEKTKRRMTQSVVGLTSYSAWKIGACDVDGYDALDYMIVDESEVPPLCRNKTFNRYMDILPTPRTRVKLPEDPMDPTASYINANYIRGSDGNERAFIAAMGPKAATVNHFWRMIWQEKPPVIIMITGLIENGKQKCERYWPGKVDGKTVLTFGNIRVMNMSSQQKNGYVVSTLKATGIDAATGKRRSHTMLHFWYNTWPDHGVPRQPGKPLFVDNVLAMKRDVDKHMLSKGVQASNPTLIHCSAGVGRTGTYIAIDHEIRLLEQSGKCDPLKITEEIRQDRCALVQHPMQFKFVHEAAMRYAEEKGVPFEVEDKKDNTARSIYSMDFGSMDIDGGKEKEVARERKARASMVQASMGPRIGRRQSVVKTQTSLCLDLGSVTYQGQSYTFLDPEGSGFMSTDAAEIQGMPIEFFRMMNTSNSGVISVAEYKSFERTHRMLASIDLLHIAE